MHLPLALQAAFSRLLIIWQDQHGRKDLPWQKTTDPYAVWVAEIMLQQTQVTTVISYYTNFMQRFPNVYALARASNDEVMHAWAGLGYYRRARNLHTCAQTLINDFAGNWPSDITTLCKLPGIGRSTAGAIASSCFSVSAAILDGNVKRVLSRFTGITAAIDTSATEKKLWQLAETLLPKTNAHQYNQALMDLGSNICSKHQPKCPFCPLQQDCQAYRHQLTHIIPIKKTKNQRITHQRWFLQLCTSNELLLVKRDAYTVWSNLWCLPEFTSLEAMQSYVFNFAHSSCEISRSQYHEFTHFRLQAHYYRAFLKNKPSFVFENAAWVNTAKLNTYALPAPITRYLKQAWLASHNPLPNNDTE